MAYARRTMRRYRKSNTQAKSRRFFRSYRKNIAASNRYSRINNKYRRTKVKVPTRVLPDYTLVKLKCSSTFEIPAGSTPGVGTYSFSQATAIGNDIFDPFGTLSVDQPNGFDQWMAFYRNFIVHKSSIKVTPMYWNVDAVVDGGPIMPFQLSIVPYSTSAGFPSPGTSDPSELPYAKSKLYSGVFPQTTGVAPQYIAASTPGQQAMVGLVNSMMTKKILGYKDLSDVETVRGSATASPAETFSYAIICKSTIPGAGAALTNFRLSPLGIRVDMYFKCQLLNRVDVPDSVNDN